MMAAMMLPSAVPMILLHRLGASEGSGRALWSGAFVGGYLLVWTAVGLVVWAGAMAAEAFLDAGQRAIGIAAVFLLAGVYQFTPLKSVCLRACRTPADFLLTHWHRGLAGQVRLGVEHGFYCLGCCWALMVLFVTAGAMSLAWAAAIAALVFVEKVVPRGPSFGRVVGAAFVVAAIVLFARPDLANAFGNGM